MLRSWGGNLHTELQKKTWTYIVHIQVNLTIQTLLSNKVIKKPKALYLSNFLYGSWHINYKTSQT